MPNEVLIQILSGIRCIYTENDANILLCTAKFYMDCCIEMEYEYILYINTNLLQDFTFDRLSYFYFPIGIDMSMVDATAG